MGKVIYDLSMSLDGFIAGANVRPEAGLGDGGEALHEWAMSNGDDPYVQSLLASYVNTGATITGRVTYDLSVPYWGADGPMGSVRLPTIVVTHSIPKDAPPNSVYSFVNGIEAAYQKAQAVAGDKEISISGSEVATQFLQRGLIDELWLHVVPVLFGSGVPLMRDVESKHIKLEIVEVVHAAGAVHQRYRVVK